MKDQIQVTKAAEHRVMAGQALFVAIAINFPKGVIRAFNTDMEFVNVEGKELNRLDLNKSDFEGKTFDEAAVISKELKEKIKEDIQKTICKHLSFELEYGKESYSVNAILLSCTRIKTSHGHHLFTAILLNRNKCGMNCKSPLKPKKN